MNNAAIPHVRESIDKLLHVEQRRPLRQRLLADELEEVWFRGKLLYYVVAVNLLDLGIELLHIMPVESLPYIGVARAAEQFLNAFQVVTSVGCKLERSLDLLISQSLVCSHGNILRQKEFPFANLMDFYNVFMAQIALTLAFIYEVAVCGLLALNLQHDVRVAVNKHRLVWQL